MHNILIAEILSNGRGLTKGKVYRSRINDHELVVKDFSTKNIWLKPLMRYLAYREGKILQRIQALSIAPKFYGFLSPYKFVYEYVDGLPPRKFECDFDNAAYEKALLALDEFHQAGFVHNDVRPKNMIVTRDGELRFIDFGAAAKTDNTWLARLKLFSGSWFSLVKKLQQADKYHLVKMKAACDKFNLTRDEQAILGQGRPFKSASLVWKRAFR